MRIWCAYCKRVQEVQERQRRRRRMHEILAGYVGVCAVCGSPVSAIGQTIRSMHKPDQHVTSGAPAYAVS